MSSSSSVLCESSDNRVVYGHESRDFLLHDITVTTTHHTNTTTNPAITPISSDDTWLRVGVVEVVGIVVEV
eukprot:m.102790 g.102790  ORF g.102790 m.102790 type:complete len:71 (-) comp27436_c1_seq1:128-340(-)